MHLVAVSGDSNITKSQLTGVKPTY